METHFDAMLQERKPNNQADNVYSERSNMSKELIPPSWSSELSMQPATGNRNTAGGTTACRNPFDLPTIYSTGLSAQACPSSLDNLVDNMNDSHWQNLIGSGNTDIPPRTLQQPLWSSVASQSIASTQPIGSKPHTAATSTTHPISAWNTEHTQLQSCNGGSPNSMMNIREGNDNFYGEGQRDALKKQASSIYQGPDSLGIRTASNKGISQIIVSTVESNIKVQQYNLQTAPSNGPLNIPLCTACCGESKNPVTSRCRDCNEDLCEACVGAHQRVKLTREHSIVRYPPSSKSAFGHTGIPSKVATSVGTLELNSARESNTMNKGLPLKNFNSKCIPSSTTDGTTTGASSSSPNTNSPPSLAPVLSIEAGISKLNPFTDVNGHPKLMVPSDSTNYDKLIPKGMNTQPTTAQSDVMRVYTDVVEKAKVDCDKLLIRAKQEIRQVEESQCLVAEMGGRVNQRHKMLQKEIKATTQQHMNAIREREQLLMLRLEKVRQVKLKTLEQQQNELTLTSICLQKAAEELSLSGQSGRELDLINSCNKAVDIVREVQGRCGNLAVQEDDIIEYVPPDSSLLTTLNGNAFGSVNGSGYAPASLAEGDGLSKAILGKDAHFIVVIKDQLNEQRSVGGDPLTINIVAPDGRPVRHKLFDGQNGIYRVIWKPNLEGEHVLSITLKSLHIKDSPFKVNVRSGRNYFVEGDKMIFEFGGEGEKDGQLCRPWGVCCSREGYILVANRSNNRIEVYTRDGKFKHKFGTGGKLKGQFDRPASVMCDRMNRAIIADKDNHRIQIFTVEGEYLMDFGEKGQKNGQFNYPWDIACNSKDQILVSDTRNHRIQLFSPNGEYINKYGFEGAHWKHFDSPRGVCFTADDKAVVTDFNNHRLLVVKSDLNTAQFLGKEGSDDGMFMRPNGVAVDEEGNFIVADSRNDRVQIFSSSGVFIKKFGTKGTGPGEFDRPSGVCVSPEGLVIVVDFGNNRVQVF